MPDFLDLKTTYLIFHILGAIIGGGAAFVGDVMFFSTIRDGRIDRYELRFMKLAGRTVWFGLAVLFISGLLLFSTAPEVYLASSKFLSKMTIVGIIAANGLVFHLIHLPHIGSHLGLKFAESPTFVRRTPLILASGAISSISWLTTIFLALTKDIPYSYPTLMGGYLVVVGFGVICATALKKIIFKIP